MKASNYHFRDRQDVASFLFTDWDGYVKSMSPYDLHARGVAMKHQYRTRSANAAMDFTPAMQLRMTRACAMVDAELMNNQRLRHACMSYGMDPDTMAGIAWKLALTNGTAYEEGLPHTREDTIFVSTEFFDENSIQENSRTLLHEKVHLYQRLYREACTRQLFALGFTVHKLRKQVEMIRCNPDLDGIIYRDPKGKVLACFYRNKAPRSIRDVVYMSSCKTEHPFEKIAYELGDMLHHRV